MTVVITVVMVSFDWNQVFIYVELEIHVANADRPSNREVNLRVVLCCVFEYVNTEFVYADRSMGSVHYLLLH